MQIGNWNFKNDNFPNSVTFSIEDYHGKIIILSISIGSLHSEFNRQFNKFMVSIELNNCLNCVRYLISLM